jgi:peptide/nickel transport system substrate-binding protein
MHKSWPAGLLLLIPPLLATSGCRSDSGSAARSQGDGAAARGGGVLVAALSAAPEHFNPAITTQGGVHTVSALLYNGLVELDEELEPVPALAERWEVEAGGRIYRFHLRPDVVWHDGEPFTAADVRYTFEEVLLKYHARTRASLGTSLEEIAAPDEHTVEFRFREPYAPLLRQLNVLEAPILPSHVYAGTDPTRNPANLDPIGTGPFRFVSYTPGSEIRYEANPHYFLPGLPRLDRIVFRVIPDNGSRVIALEAGEVDWLFGVPGPDQGRLRANPDIELMSSPRSGGGDNCIMTLSFNLDRPVLRDVRVRRAIAYAIDRDQFVERVLFGDGRVADAPISSGIPFAHARGLDMPTFDPAAARRLLEQAGWSREAGRVRRAQDVAGVPYGTPLEIDFLHFPAFTPYGELLRAQLGRVGVRVRLRALEPAVFVESVFRDRDFDTNIISYCNSTDPEIGVRRLYISANIAPVPFSNSSGYRNASVDSLFDAARSTLDTAERRRLYRQIQGILVEDLPYYWIVETLATRAYRTRCRGFRLTSHFAERATCSP